MNEKTRESMNLLGDLKSLIIKSLDQESLKRFAEELMIDSGSANTETDKSLPEVPTYQEVYGQCYQEFKDETIKQGNSPASLQNFKGVIEKYILRDDMPYDSFKDTAINLITIYDVKKLKKSISSDCKNRKGEPLSKARVNHIYSEIDRVFKFGADLGYVSVSFCNEIKIQLVTGTKSKNRKLTRNFMDESEYQLFYKTFDRLGYQYFKGNKEIRISQLHECPANTHEIATFRCLLYRALFSLYFWTGARTNEGRGLRWTDLILPSEDFPLYRLKLDKQYKEKGASLIDLEVYTLKPKTDDSNRIITCNNQFIEDLRRLKQYLIVHGLYDEDNYIFYDFYCKNPKPIPEANIARCFRYIIDESGIEKNSIVLNHEHRNITPYGMRHAACSCLLERGMPIEDVAKHLGHSNSEMVKYVYSHFIDPAHVQENKKQDNIQYFL